jgi:hypothetical protein
MKNSEFIIFKDYFNFRFSVLEIGIVILHYILKTKDIIL